MGSMPSSRVFQAYRPALPRRIVGKGGSSVFIVLALLAIAIFFYVRAVAPPPASAPSTVSGEASRAPLAATPATLGLPPAPPAGGEPAAAALDPKLVDALSNVVKQPPEPGEAAAEPAAAAPASEAAAAEAPASPAAGPQPVPTAQMDLLKDVFAPELDR